MLLSQLVSVTPALLISTVGHESMAQGYLRKRKRTTLSAPINVIGTGFITEEEAHPHAVVTAGIDDPCNPLRPRINGAGFFAEEEAHGVAEREL